MAAQWHIPSQAEVRLEPPELLAVSAVAALLIRALGNRLPMAAAAVALAGRATQTAEVERGLQALAEAAALGAPELSVLTVV